jgi:hypothetical protein
MLRSVDAIDTERLADCLVEFGQEADRLLRQVRTQFPRPGVSSFLVAWHGSWLLTLCGMAKGDGKKAKGDG